MLCLIALKFEHKTIATFNHFVDMRRFGGSLCNRIVLILLLSCRADSLDGLNSFTAIETLAGRLKWQLDAGNLLRLAIDAPIYGSLSSIRFLLADQIARLYYCVISALRPC